MLVRYHVQYPYPCPLNRSTKSQSLGGRVGDGLAKNTGETDAAVNINIELTLLHYTVSISEVVTYTVL